MIIYRKALITIFFAGNCTVFAAHEVVEQLPKNEAIQLILGDTHVITENQRQQIAKQLLDKMESDQDLVSSIHDAVTPIREPIYISSDPSSVPAIIYVTPSRPTTVSFFKQGGEPLAVIKLLEQDIDSETPRFKTTPIEGLNYAFSFKTNVRKGKTTTDFFFEGVPYSIPIQMVAGSKFHSSAQAVLIEASAPIRETEKNNNDIVSGRNIETSLPINALRQILYAYANYNQKPSAGTFDPVNVEFFSSSAMAQPHVSAILATIDGKETYFLRTNGHLVHPDYVASEPANNPNETVWVYAIPRENVSNLISISYRGASHLVNLEISSAIGLASTRASLQN